MLVNVVVNVNVNFHFKVNVPFINRSVVVGAVLKLDGVGLVDNRASTD